MIVSVQWVDNKTETYNCDSWKVIDGVLWLKRLNRIICIPYDVNVRIWELHGTDDELQQRLCPSLTPSSR